MLDVITFGSATRDIFLSGVTWEVEKSRTSPTGLDACLPFGTKIPVDDITFANGGGALNAATTFRRLGDLRVGTVCRIGTDHSARALLDAMRADGISPRYVQQDKRRHTGYSTILLSGSGERTILVYRGAAAHLSTRSVPWKNLKASWFYIASLGGELATAERIVRHARSVGARVAWNPGGNELVHGLKALAPILAHVDILLLNRHEAAQLAKKPRSDIAGIFSLLYSAQHSPGVTTRATIITDAAKGSYVCDGQQVWHSGTRSIKAKNTTGAGDAFGSGFVVARAHELEITDALRVATMNAEGVIQKMGATNGILTRLPSRASFTRIRITKLTK
jgi:sugar/nucleoside kinase (ribokinase family)